jgi:hypothetical protein
VGFQVGLSGEIALNLHKEAIFPLVISLRWAGTKHPGDRYLVRKAFDAGPRLVAASDLASQIQRQHAD